MSVVDQPLLCWLIAFKVIVLRDGKITEIGTYEQLLGFVVVTACCSCAYSTATRSNNGDFSRFITEFQTDLGESSTDDIDPALRIASLKVRMLCSEMNMWLDMEACRKSERRW